jgi:hypothetical protein
MEEPIKPIEEMMPEEEFTDRVEILRELDEWIKNISRMASSSTAIISPRRMGKTSLLDRLVNTVFFKDYKVAPFYFKMKREETTLREFLLEYATTFFKQYIAYCMKDPFLYRDQSMSLEDLLDIESSHKAVEFTRVYIERFLKRFKTKTDQDARNHWDAFITIPELIASMTGTRVAVIIDEFQDMKFYIYPTDKILKDKLQLPMATDLTATYDRQSQSRKAPMLVSGSAVTLIFRTVMGGPLGGRFNFKYLKPLSIADGATLIKNLLETKNLKINEENAIYLSSEAGGHPYYLYCCAESDFQDKDFESKEKIDKILEYEVASGKIFGFWETHFAYNREYLNADNDIQLGKKIIYYFTKYNNQPVLIDEIAGKLNVAPTLVEEKIEKLYLADLVYRSDFKYYTFNDIMLMRYIQRRYEKDLEGMEKIDLRRQGIFNTVKGAFLELVVENLMWKFNGEELDGKLFGREGTVKVPLFRYVGGSLVKPENSPGYQVDVYGIQDEHTGAESLKNLWVAECKYRKQPMTRDEIQKAIAAADALKLDEAKYKVKVNLRVWVVSTGGFTADAMGFLRQSDLYYTDHQGINELFRIYGGGIKIPVFETGADDQ